jgi:hypothetical protein
MQIKKKTTKLPKITKNDTLSLPDHHHLNPKECAALNREANLHKNAAKPAHHNCA